MIANFGVVKLSSLTGALVSKNTAVVATNIPKETNTAPRKGFTLSETNLERTSELAQKKAGTNETMMILRASGMWLDYYLSIVYFEYESIYY